MGEYGQSFVFDSQVSEDVVNFLKKWMKLKDNDLKENKKYEGEIRKNYGHIKQDINLPNGDGVRIYPSLIEYYNHKEKSIYRCYEIDGYKEWRKD